MWLLDTAQLFVIVTILALVVLAVLDPDRPEDVLDDQSAESEPEPLDRAA